MVKRRSLTPGTGSQKGDVHATRRGSGAARKEVTDRVCLRAGTVELTGWALNTSCGLYRTTKPLAGHEEQFPAGLLVYFHNHSESGLPQVLAPDHNVHNRWHFHGPPIEFRGLSWADSLVKVPLEGFYVLKRELSF